MSRSHMGSNLILQNILAGVDESTVAYFPFNTSPIDMIKQIVPADGAAFEINNGVVIEADTGFLKYFMDLPVPLTIHMEYNIDPAKLNSTNHLLYLIGTSSLSLSRMSAQWVVNVTTPRIVVNDTLTNGYHDFCICIEPDALRLYIDGALVGSGVPGSTLASFAAMDIGSLDAPLSQANSGIKNLIIYNRILSDDEIAQLSKGTYHFSSEEVIL